MTGIILQVCELMRVGGGHSDPEFQRNPPEYPIYFGIFPGQCSGKISNIFCDRLRIFFFKIVATILRGSVTATPFRFKQ